ncbi:MAG: MEDS domain-containing protein [Candidatus Korobacteraceae bacterium]
MNEELDNRGFHDLCDRCRKRWRDWRSMCGITREGRFAMCDAQEMLAMFMVDGLPDPDLFMASVGKLLLDAKQAASSKEQGLTVFGEMVALLWEAGNKSGAVALETLWNEVMSERAFHLHCAYPRWLFGSEAEFAVICGSHSHILGLAPAV